MRTKSLRQNVLLGAAVALPLTVLGAGSAQAAGVLKLTIPSDRADLISGGETLAAVSLPRSVNPSSVTVTLNGSNVSSAFAMRPNGSFEGLVSGLTPASNILRAEAPGA